MLFRTSLFSPATQELPKPPGVPSHKQPFIDKNILTLGQGGEPGLDYSQKLPGEITTPDGTRIAPACVMGETRDKRIQGLIFLGKGREEFKPFETQGPGSQATSLAQAPDGRIFCARENGHLGIVHDEKGSNVSFQSLGNVKENGSIGEHAQVGKIHFDATQMHQEHQRESGMGYLARAAREFKRGLLEQPSNEQDILVELPEPGAFQRDLSRVRHGAAPGQSR